MRQNGGEFFAVGFKPWGSNPTFVMRLLLWKCVVEGGGGWGWGWGWGWGLDAPAHTSATILWLCVTCSLSLSMRCVKAGAQKNILLPTLPSDVISRHFPSLKSIFDAKFVIYVKNRVRKGAQCRFSLWRGKIKHIGKRNCLKTVKKTWSISSCFFSSMYLFFRHYCIES